MVIGFRARKEKAFKAEGNNLSFVFLIKMSNSKTTLKTQIKQFRETFYERYIIY